MDCDTGKPTIDESYEVTLPPITTSSNDESYEVTTPPIPTASETGPTEDKLYETIASDYD